MNATRPRVAVIGGGPAGLMAAETLAAADVALSVYERMPTVGRKLLMAGRGGLNLTHSEGFEPFLSRYGLPAETLRPMLEAFPPSALRAWAKGLDQATFVGSSGRVFPRTLKASPLVRAWLKRLVAQGVEFRTRREWLGWDAEGALMFRLKDGRVESARADATVLTLGGSSWPRLGSNGAWADILRAKGVPISPFRPANCGFTVGWSELFRDRFAGAPLKTVALRFQGRTVRGEATVTRYGLEGGAVYALSSALRDAIDAHERADLSVDLRPDLTAAEVVNRLAAAARPGQSRSTLLRKALHLPPVAVGLLREGHGVQLATDPAGLAAQVKAAPLTLLAAQPLDRAISTAGGVRFDALDATLQLRAAPGVFVAGEMLDWEAPTGGYLLQACFATGVAAARGVLTRLGVSGP